MFRYQNAFAVPKKSKKLGIFGYKKGPQYYGGDFWHILIEVPGGFLMIFLIKQHQPCLY
jgi:hypothetical protein